MVSLSWITDYLRDYTPAGILKKGVDTLTAGLSYDLQGHDSPIANGVRDVADLWQEEVTDKTDLRLAQTESVLSGIPIVGSIIRGVEGAQQLEDYYNNTGQTPQYPAGTSLSAAGVGAGISSLGSTIAGGQSQGYKAGKMSLEDFYLSYY